MEQVNVSGNGGDVNIFLRGGLVKTEPVGLNQATALAPAESNTEQLAREDRKARGANWRRSQEAKMDEEIVQQIVDELFSSLEPLDTQSAALLQFLKAKGIAGEEELAPYLEQAGTASSVRWLAARVRIKSLIASAMRTEETKPAEQRAEKKSSETSNEPAAKGSPETQRAGETGAAGQDSEKSAPAQAEERVTEGAEDGASKKESKPIPADQDVERNAA